MEQIIEEKKLENVSGGANRKPSEMKCPRCGVPILMKKSLLSSAKPGVCSKCGYELGKKWQ